MWNLWAHGSGPFGIGLKKQAIPSSGVKNPDFQYPRRLLLAKFRVVLDQSQFSQSADRQASAAAITPALFCAL
jgi:hypothetical protein